MGRLIFIALALFAALFSVVIYIHNSVFILQGPDNGFLLTKTEIVRYSVYLPAFYVHIVTGSIVLLAGVLQLSKAIRLNAPAWHRRIGKLYVFMILLLTAPSGLIMSFFANGGLPAKVGFALLAVLWWYFTGMGWRAAWRKRWDIHREFMIRSYALTFAAVTLRFYSFLFALFDLRGEFVYIIIVWLSWVPSLVAAEIWINRTRKKDLPVT